jgi:protein-S-isoprenylcysteine O-methyltransferase Ste14
MKSLRLLILFIELLLFSGFTWVIVAWFKKGSGIHRWEIKFVKIAGLFFTIAQLAAAAFYPSAGSALSLTGISVLLLSAGLFLWSIFTFKQRPPAIAFADNIVSPLKTTGAYKIVRNPFYTSYSLAWIGGAIATGCWWLITSFACMFPIYLKAARSEQQQWLSTNDAATYRAYMQTTGMFLPKGRALWSLINAAGFLVIAMACITILILFLTHNWPSFDKITSPFTP